MQIAPIKLHASKQPIKWKQIRGLYIYVSLVVWWHWNFCLKKNVNIYEDDDVNGQDDTITWFLPICITLSLFVIHWCIILCLMINVTAQLGVVLSRWYTCLTFIYNYCLLKYTDPWTEMNIMIYMTQNDGETLYNTVCSFTGCSSGIWIKKEYFITECLKITRGH